MMRYIVNVAVIFSSDVRGAKSFDLWENVILLDAEGSRNALDKAISLSRNALSNPESLKELGYAHEPVIYGVSSVHTHLALPSMPVVEQNNGMYLTKLTSLNEMQLQDMRSFREVLIPYKLMHIL